MLHTSRPVLQPACPVPSLIQSVSGFVSVETVTSVQEKGKQDDSFFGRIQCAVLPIFVTPTQLAGD